MSTGAGMEDLQAAPNDSSISMDATPTPAPSLNMQTKQEPLSPQPQSQPEDQQNNQQQQQEPEPQLSKEEPRQSEGQTYLRESNIFDAISEFDSSIPDQVVQHFLNVAGMQTTDQRIVRLIAIAAQKFIHDIVSDSLQHCKLRGAQGKKAKDKKFTLVMEDLAAALAEYGIEVKRQSYFN